MSVNISSKSKPLNFACQ